jgi:ribonuclease R
MNDTLSSGQILNFFKERRGAPATIKEIMRELGIAPQKKPALRQLLRELEKSGQMTFLPKKLYAPMGAKKFVEGIVKRNPKGFGWLETDDHQGEGIFIPPPEMSSLMDGDRVRCRLEPNPKGPVGHVEQIVARAKEFVVGTFYRRGRQEYVEIDGFILAAPVVIHPKYQSETKEIASETVVEVQITHYPDRNRDAMGRITRVLGKRGDFISEVESILVASKLERTFSREAEQQAHFFGEDPRPQDRANRRDLTQIALCTIDGETAKDFDDAVHGRLEGDDYWVTVAIADVSHYVAEGSAIDLDAFTRGTSVYYPGHCIPMIPEALSNGLCSLKPNVPRLCMTVEMQVSKTGAVKKVEVGEATMFSHARLTYNLVQAYLDSKFKAMREIPVAVGESIQVLVDASRALRKARAARGAIDFDVTESLVALDDDGEPIAINPSERLEAHRLIEDLMVAANEAVARHLEKKGWPTVFRIHEPPQAEKLKHFLKMAHGVGAISAAEVRSLEKEEAGPKPFAKLMAKLEGHPAKVALDTLMLRSMMQARYSAHNVGHYGLASKSYLHFTSPIRRYPDLVAHRILRESMKRKRKLTETEVEARTADLEGIAMHCSDRERKAVDVERQIQALHACWIMRDKIGEEDIGTVTSCTEFGIFVRLTKYHIEGLIHVTALGRGHIQYEAEHMRLVEKSTGRIFAIGDKLEVKVASVNVSKRHIDLSLVKGEKAPEESVRGKPKREKKKKKR